MTDEEILAEFEAAKSMPTRSDEDILAEFNAAKSVPTPSVEPAADSSSSVLDYLKMGSQLNPMGIGNLISQSVMKDPRGSLTKLASALSGAAEGLTFGVGNELIAGGAALTDMPFGESFGDAYSNRMQQLQDIQKEEPTINAAADLTASLYNPYNALNLVKKGGVAGTMAKGALGSAQGALEGYLRDETNRGSGAILGGALGGALPVATDAIGATGRFLSNQGRRFQRGAIIPEGFQKSSGKTPMLASEAFDIAQKEGIYKGSLSGKALKQKSTDALKAVGGELNDIKKQVSAMIPEESLSPALQLGEKGIQLSTKNRLLKENLRFDNTAAFLNKIKKPSVRAEAEKIIQDNYEQYFGKSGALRNLDVEEMLDTSSFLRSGQYSNKETITPLQRNIDKFMGEDISESAIRITDNVIGAGKIGSVNKRYQALKTLETLHKDLGNKEEVGNLVKALIFRPTGNPIADSMITGGVAASSLFAPQTIPLFLAAKLLGTRKGQMLGAQGIENLGQGMQFAGKTPASELTRAILSIKGSGE